MFSLYFLTIPGQGSFERCVEVNRSFKQRPGSKRKKERQFMKREKLHSSRWMLGGVAALIFLGSGSLAGAQIVTSYNDLAWGTGQLDTDITTFTSPAGGSGLPSSGQLIDFATGTPTSVSLTITGGTFGGDPGAAQGADPTIGDAENIFNGNVSEHQAPIQVD